MKKIIVGYGMQKKIAEDIGCSTRTVQSALLFMTEGAQSELIRIKAMRDYNGVLTKRPQRTNFKK